MKKDDQDQLLRAIDRVIKPSVKLTEKVELTPKLPSTREEWSAPLKTLDDQLQVAVRVSKQTSVTLDKQDSGVQLTVRKKF